VNCAAETHDRLEKSLGERLVKAADQAISVAQEQPSMWQRGLTHPDRIAVIEPDGWERTYRDLTVRINQWSNLILDRGIGRGDRVALMAPNSFEWLAIAGACLQIGVFLVPVNFHLNADEAAYIVSDSASAILIVDERLADVGGDLAVRMSLAETALVALGDIDGFQSHEALLAGMSHERPISRLAAGEKMYYTSGTTGRPKGVVRPLPNVENVDLAAVESAHALFVKTGRDPDPDGVVLVPGPLYHGAPLGSALGALQLGQAVVLMDKWTPERFLELVALHRVTATTMVPTMFERLIKLPETVRGGFDVSSLKSVSHAGAPCAPGTKRAMIEWLGPILNEYYASTEGPGTSVTSAEWLERPGTVGRPANPGGVRILALDEDCLLGAHEIGRVFLELTRPFEYLGDAEKTAATVVDGYFTVGDIGCLDDDGYLFLCDRAADTIISGGVNIYPAEIEAALSTHPLVQDVAVIGVPNEEWGEEIKAVVQLRDGAGGSGDLADQLIALARQHLSRFKVPRSVDFVQQLPRAENGKLYKRQLREKYWPDGARKI
jgi:long-chain acyl-CoA synthetase